MECDSRCHSQRLRSEVKSFTYTGIQRGSCRKLRRFSAPLRHVMGLIVGFLRGHCVLLCDHQTATTPLRDAKFCPPKFFHNNATSQSSLSQTTTMKPLQSPPVARTKRCATETPERDTPSKYSRLAGPEPIFLGKSLFTIKKRSLEAIIDLTEDEETLSVSEKLKETAPESPKKKTPTRRPYRPTYLGRLPGELRNRIYHHIGYRHARLDLSILEEPAISAALPTLKDEINSVIFSDNKLRVPVYTEFRANYDPKPLPKGKPRKKKIDDTVNASGYETGEIAIQPDSWVLDVHPNYVVMQHLCFRVMESFGVQGVHRHLADYFLNVRFEEGKPIVSHQLKIMVANDIKKTFKQLYDLATAKAKRMGQQEGFQGFNWEQTKEIAESFKSVQDSKSKYTRHLGRVRLIEE